MADTNFIPRVTQIVSTWLQDVNDAVYRANSAISGVTSAMYRTALSKSADSISVKDFGAIGNLTADDTAAIQAAITSLTAGQTLYFPSGQYRITQPLNITNRSSGALRFKGDTRGENTVGSQIVGETGGLMLDCTGSQYIVFEDLVIKSGSLNRSTVGILFARSVTASFAQFNAMRRCLVDIATNTAANSGNGTVAVYNYAAELFVMEDCFLKADTPYVITQDNTTFALASSFTTISSGAQSCSHLAQRSCSFVSYAFAGMRLEAVILDVTCDDCYWLRTSGSYKYAIDLRASLFCGRFNGNIEGFQRVVYLTFTSECIEFNLHTIGVNAESLFFLESVAGSVPGLRASKVSCRSTSVTTQNLIETSGSQNGVEMCEIWLHGSQTLSMAGGFTTSNYIHTQQSSVTGITVSGSAGFFSNYVAYRGGHQFTGTAGFTGRLQPATLAGAAQTGSFWMGTGVPSNAAGTDGDFFFRTEGTQAGNTVLYHKETGAWVALITT